MHNADIDSSAFAAASVSPVTSLLSNISNSRPISLLAQVDDEDYYVLTDAAAIVPIRLGNLNTNMRHEIRIIAPMVGSSAETLQVEGIWIDESGNLCPFEVVGSVAIALSESSLEEHISQFRPAKNTGRKMLEIVTDLPGSRSLRNENEKATTRGVIGGVLGWEYLLGEMFASDHVTIGMDVSYNAQNQLIGRNLLEL